MIVLLFRLWNADGLAYFDDLMDESFSSSLDILEKDYDDAIRNKGELDERVFLNQEDSLLGSGSSSGCSMNISGVKVFIFHMHSILQELCSFLNAFHCFHVPGENFF